MYLDFFIKLQKNCTYVLYVCEHYSVGNCGRVVRRFGRVSDDYLLWHLLPSKVRINYVYQCITFVINDKHCASRNIILLNIDRL